MTVNFRDAKLGDTANTWDWHGEDFGWVTDTDYFHDDLIDPVTTKRRTWRLIAETTVTFHPSTELCPECHGDETVPSPVGIDIDCPTCIKDPGRHPLAGQQEVHDGTP